MSRLTLCVLILVSSLLSAGEIQRIGSEELPVVLKPGDRLTLVLKNGTLAEGKLEEVSEQSLTLDVKKSDTLDDLPQGKQSITLDRVASVTVSRYRGNKRKWLPAILVWTLGTLSFVAAAASEERRPKTVPAAAGFTAGLGLAGYFGGRALDKEQITFTLK